MRLCLGLRRGQRRVEWATRCRQSWWSSQNGGALETVVLALLAVARTLGGELAGSVQSDAVGNLESRKKKAKTPVGAAATW
jgi:hypothetical protein